MIYQDFQGKRLSMLGFGTMRLPLLEGGSIDADQVQAMTDYAMEQGVNYFDTAYPYHDCLSEVVIGKALAKYPRERFYLATKYPGHQLSDTYDPAAIFEEQLQKCGVKYFDFYLLHNVYENSIDTYLDPRWGIIDYFREQKRLGRIRHLGFSSHGDTALLKRFLDEAGEDMEFCQIQLNYLDWTLQNAKEKVALLNERNIPIWVMEPVRGGSLNKADISEKMHAATGEMATAPAWCFRFLQGIPGVTVVLSGMSAMAQMEENVATFAAPQPTTPAQTQALLDIAEGMKDSVPCTACRYCTADCPMGLDIPKLIAVYNELRITSAMTVSMRLEGIDAPPSSCLGCGKCARLCPQHIDIPTVMKDLAAKLESLPKWADACREREAAARALRGE